MLRKCGRQRPRLELQNHRQNWTTQKLPAFVEKEPTNQDRRHFRTRRGCARGVARIRHSMSRSCLRRIFVLCFSVLLLYMSDWQKKTNPFPLPLLFFLKNLLLYTEYFFEKTFDSKKEHPMRQDARALVKGSYGEVSRQVVFQDSSFAWHRKPNA